MSKFKILLKMTGSIACFKACQIISGLTQMGHEVKVVASASALQFVGAATLEGLSGRPIISELFQSGFAMDHIHDVRWADLILVAPATANYINKAAAGIGDDLVSTMFLAHDFKKPYVIVPAMNSSMYQHPATQNSILRLKEMGIHFLDPEIGKLACGEFGPGRFCDPQIIIEKTLGFLQKNFSTTTTSKDHQPMKILVTAGGTQVPIDTVRHISNVSTGKTGATIAAKLAQLDSTEVTLLSTKMSFPLSNPQLSKDFKKVSPIKEIFFTTYDELQTQIESELKNNSYTHIIHLAAVSDYKVEKIFINGKASKDLKLESGQNVNIQLSPTPKIIDQIRHYSKNPKLKIVAFKLTSGASPEEKQQKVAALFEHSQADWVVQNDLTEINKLTGQHKFCLFNKDLSFQNLNNVDDLTHHLFAEFTREAP